MLKNDIEKILNVGIVNDVLSMRMNHPRYYTVGYKKGCTDFDICLHSDLVDMVTHTGCLQILEGMYIVL